VILDEETKTVKTSKNTKKTERSKLMEHCIQAERITKLELKIDDLYRLNSDTSRQLTRIETTLEAINNTVNELKITTKELNESPKKFYSKITVGVITGVVTTILTTILTVAIMRIFNK